MTKIAWDIIRLYYLTLYQVLQIHIPNYHENLEVKPVKMDFLSSIRPFNSFNRIGNRLYEI